MKMKIEWYEDCVKNQKLHLDEKRKELERLQSEIDRCVYNINFRMMQIEEAKKQDKDSFDDQRFMVKKGDK